MNADTSLAVFAQAISMGVGALLTYDMGADPDQWDDIDGQSDEQRAAAEDAAVQLAASMRVILDVFGAVSVGRFAAAMAGERPARSPLRAAFAVTPVLTVAVEDSLSIVLAVPDDAGRVDVPNAEALNYALQLARDYVRVREAVMADHRGDEPAGEAVMASTYPDATSAALALNARRSSTYA